MKIFLLGLPGSGKSTLGKELADLISIPFIDLDDEIEKKEEQAVAQVFKEKGEDYFRVVESELLKKWCIAEGSFVMATGGGAPCFFNNMTVMNLHGKSVFLDVPPAEIAGRILKTKIEDRPLLASKKADLPAYLDELLAKRISFYQQASHIFSGAAIDVREILRAVKT